MSEKTHAIIETLQYVQSFYGKRILIKLSGSIMDDKEGIKNFCEDLSLLRAAGMGLVLVHGGGKSIEAELNIHQLTWEFHEGQRITTKEMINIIEMTLCGHVNRTIVRTLNTLHISAIGISGSDASMLRCSRVNEILGEVGQIEEIDVTLVERCLLDQSQRLTGHIPVIAPIGVDDEGEALNINADYAAAALARALKVDKLIYLTDQDGIYDRHKNIFSELNYQQLQNLLDEEVVTDGMIPKVKTIMETLRHGIPAIHILNAKRSHVLITELFTAQGVGTLCRFENGH